MLFLQIPFSCRIQVHNRLHHHNPLCRNNAVPLSVLELHQANVVKKKLHILGCFLILHYDLLACMVTYLEHTGPKESNIKQGVASCDSKYRI